MMQLVSPFRGIEQYVKENVPLARYTWFKLGGPARWLLTPRNEHELRQAWTLCGDSGIPVYILGLGANVLIGDSGIDAAVFLLNEDYWREITINGHTVRAGAGADMQKLVVKAVRQGLAGLECLAGIPGTVGGGIRMNAGGRFGDIGSVVSRVSVMEQNGQPAERQKDQLSFEYRKGDVGAPIILDATFDLEEDDPDQVLHRTREIWMYKRNSQPLNAKSAGCIFKNPPGERSAGSLIDQAGMKGFRVGGAEVSAKHANFIIANPGCTAADVLRLIDIVRQRVFDKFGIWLETEVQIWPLTQGPRPRITDDPGP